MRKFCLLIYPKIKLVRFDDINNNKITLKYISGAVGIDSENAQMKQVPVNGKDAQYYYKGGLSTLIFFYSNQTFMLQGNLPEQEIVRMAESIRIYD